MKCEHMCYPDRISRQRCGLPSLSTMSGPVCHQRVITQMSDPTIAVALASNTVRWLLRPKAPC